MQDEEIIELYWARDQQAIPETEKKYGSYCQSIAYRISGSREDAEECANDTWLGAWNAMPEAWPKVLSVFLGTITRNLALDRYRKQSRKKRGGGETRLALEELAECAAVGDDPEAVIEEKELSRAIDSFLSTLSEKDRNLFVSRYWFLVPIAELAARDNCSQGKIKMQLSRQRARLRKVLEEEGFC